MTAIEWVDSPPSLASTWDATVAELQANPDQWARFGPYARGSRKITTRLRERGVDATSRTEGGRTFIYARWRADP